MKRSPFLHVTAVFVHYRHKSQGIYASLGGQSEQALTHHVHLMYACIILVLFVSFLRRLLNFNVIIKLYRIYNNNNIVYHTSYIARIFGGCAAGTLNRGN